MSLRSNLKASKAPADHEGGSTKPTGSAHPNKLSSIATSSKSDSPWAPSPDSDPLPVNTEKAMQYLADWERGWDEAAKEEKNLEPPLASAAEQSESFEDADEEDSTDSDMPKSRLARMQNQASRASPGLSRHSKVKSTKLDTSRSRGSNLQTLDHDRKALRSKLHEQSFLALSNEAHSSGSLNHTEITKKLAIKPNWIYGLPISGISETMYEHDDLVDMIAVCQNIAGLVEDNLLHLRNAGLVRENLSILILDHKRSNDTHQVAVLEKIPTRRLEMFLESIPLLLRPRDLQHLKSSVREIEWYLSWISASLLPILGLPHRAELLTERLDDFKVVKDRIWFLKCVLEILDIGLLVYEGAHCGSLDYGIWKKRQETVEDDREIVKAGSGDFPTTGYYPVQLCRLRLKCLDAFLGGRDVWVFKHKSVSLPKKPLYISTDIETFADVWGPVWKVTDKASQVSVRRYNVGGGSIFASIFDSTIHPPLQKDERLCHWNDQHADVHFENNSTPDDSEASDKDEIPFQLALAEPELLKESDRLLIGAHSNPSFRWKRCHCETAAFKQWLKEAGRLDRIIASKAYRFVESQQVSLTAGSHGVSGVLGKTFRDTKQEPVKKGILESWENNPLARDPREFENHWGVVVSLCTMNARRVRLSDLLGEDSVVGLLKPFRWSDLSWDPDRGENFSHRRSMFLEAVCSGDPCALGNLWEANPRWQEELGKVLLMLLRILCKTGYDENRDEFHILWVPEGCQSPRRITLKATDQTWTKFLKDTTYSMTVAVIVEDRLGTRRCCKEADSRWFKFPSVLETAICINESLNPAPKLLKQIGCIDKHHWNWRESPCLWRSTWDVSSVSEGDLFWTGPRSRLRVIRPLTRWHLLLKWDSVMRDHVRDMVGMRPSERVSHWEFTDKEEMEWDTRPIPVHITT
ncbi:hypothetical protein MMC22_007945 [Lobaria immixta]|nr:hypothetical protein [Lobaria immixta]